MEIIVKYIQYLKRDGLFIGNLDINNILDKNGNKLGRKINSILRKNGIAYDIRKKLLEYFQIADQLPPEKKQLIKDLIKSVAKNSS